MKFWLQKQATYTGLQERFTATFARTVQWFLTTIVRGLENALVAITTSTFRSFDTESKEEFGFILGSFFIFCLGRVSCWSRAGLWEWSSYFTGWPIWKLFTTFFWGFSFFFHWDSAGFLFLWRSTIFIWICGTRLPMNTWKKHTKQSWETLLTGYLYFFDGFWVILVLTWQIGADWQNHKEVLLQV